LKSQLITLLLLFTCLVRSQTHQPDTDGTDSLLARDYSYLSENIDKYQEKGKAWLYINAYLNKARAEGNWKEISEGYKNLLHASGEDKRLAYADSMVRAAVKTQDDDVIGSAYLTKGIVYYSLKKHTMALDNYLVANSYISLGNDDYLKYKVKYNIAHIKYYLGFYPEALALYKECVAFFRKEDSSAYLSSLHSLGLCHNRMGNFKGCSTINQFAIKECSQLNESEMLPYFSLSEGINACCYKEFAKAISLISGSLNAFERNGDFGNLSVAYFYLGKANMSLNSKGTALSYFRKVDYLFREKNYLRPDQRESYEILIRSSRETGNLEGELYYIKRLLSADSLLNITYKYLSQKVHKDYDTQELIKAKGSIEFQLRQAKMLEKVFLATIALVVVLLLYLVYRYFKAKQQYKKRFEELIGERFNKLPDTTEPIEGGADPDMEQLNIKPEVVAHIVKHLQRFEEQQKYLQKDLTAVKLAESFGTNHKYLSKVILIHKHKKFINYITDLKIDYIVHLLKDQSKFRNYTNKALAEEAGFSTTQNFTSAFLKRTHISPTYFIEELKKHYRGIEEA